MLQLYLGQQPDYMLCDITVHGIVDAMRKQHSRSTLGCRLRVLELDDGMIGDQGKLHNASFPSHVHQLSPNLTTMIVVADCHEQLG